MRDYGQIQCAFWQSEDASRLSDAGKLLAAYLMTGPHSNGIGAYRCSTGYVSDDLGWDAQKADSAFDELERIRFAMRFGNFIAIPDFLEYNKFSNGNVVKARMKELESLPKGSVRRIAALGFLKHGDHLTEANRNRLQEIIDTVPETISETVEQTVSKPSEGDDRALDAPAPPPQPADPPRKVRKSAARPPVGNENYSPGFERFWEAYPEHKRSKKMEAWARWRADNLDEYTENIIQDVSRRQREHWGWVKDGGQYIPGAQVYLNGRRWNDAFEPIPMSHTRRQFTEQTNAQRAEDWANGRDDDRVERPR